MPCYHPIPARQNERGAKVQLWPPLGTSNLAIPCGTCIGCKSSRAAQWATRCQHEARTYPHNCSIHLTYDDENLPSNGHLRPADLTNFLKRLRQHVSRNSSHTHSSGSGTLKYFACGEYGTKRDRPHYHAIIFNLTFTDTIRVGTNLYDSNLLRTIWGLGETRVGDADAAMAGYIAKYNLKQTEDPRYDPEGWTDEYGEWHPPRPRPFLRVSRDIGGDWARHYKEDLQHGYMIEGARRKTIPRRYRDKLKRHDPELAERIEWAKWRARLGLQTDRNEPQRLEAAEVIHKQRSASKERERTL